MSSHSYRDRLIVLGLVIVFTKFWGKDPLHYIAAVFLLEFGVETALMLWSVATRAEKSVK